MIETAEQKGSTKKEGFGEEERQRQLQQQTQLTRSAMKAQPEA